MRNTLTFYFWNLGNQGTNHFFFFFSSILAYLTNVFKTKAMVIKDKRVHTMTEILNSIKLIKMYAWQESFEMKIAGKSSSCFPFGSTFHLSSNIAYHTHYL